MSPTERKIKDLQEELSELLKSIPENSAGGLDAINEGKRKIIRKSILTYINELQELANKLNIISQPDFVFDPSDPKLMGELIAKTLLGREKVSLGGLKKFYGSGVYAIYYSGTFPAYQLISGKDIPIYVGKVDPATTGAQSSEEQGDRLWGRLKKDHAKNISKAINLDIADFSCRYLVVKSAWQNTAETYLIDWFKPVWNKEVGICYGIGKHGDKTETRGNTKSPWDALHPGREWAMSKLPGEKTAAEITKAIETHLTSFIPKVPV